MNTFKKNLHVPPLLCILHTYLTVSLLLNFLQYKIQDSCVVTCTTHIPKYIKCEKGKRKNIFFILSESYPKSLTVDVSILFFSHFVLSSMKKANTTKNSKNISVVVVVLVVVVELDNYVKGEVKKHFLPVYFIIVVLFIFSDLMHCLFVGELCNQQKKHKKTSSLR